MTGYTKKEVAVMAKELRTISSWRSIAEIALHWLILVTVIIATVKFLPLWLYPISMLVIGAQQYALLILLHDAQHSLLHSNKELNNWLATWLIAVPCGTEFARSQKIHLSHHQHVGLHEHDPDYPLYCTTDPYAKKSLNDFAGHFIKRCMGIKFSANVAREQSNWLPVIAMQLVIIAFFTIFSWWVNYVLLWLLPLAGLAVLFNDVRIFCEHSNAHTNSTAERDIMISYKSTPLERFFFAPNHMNYHAEHHLFPHVPHAQLPKLRALIQQTPELNDTIQWRDSYVKYLMSYLRSAGK